MPAFIAYFRVSTDRQGRSGLGLDAQREAVKSYVAGHGSIAEEFTEVESGKRNERPQLALALTACRRQSAVLVIARLDRLARNLAFIANLMESGVDFVAVDMPQANHLTMHILAAVAEDEGKRISTRTRDALAAAFLRGSQRVTAGVRAKREKSGTWGRGKLNAVTRRKIEELEPTLSVRAIAARLSISTRTVQKYKK